MVSNKLWVLTAAALLSISMVSNANQAVEGEVAAQQVAPAPSLNRFNPSYGTSALAAPTTISTTASTTESTVASTTLPTIASTVAPTIPATPPAISTGLTFNAAHPSAWMNWVDPETHLPTHMTFMNPASYTQFMKPQFYMEFMKSENLAAWMNPASYQIMMDPQTMSYWMNPGSYMHMTNPAMYQATMNPANYMIYLNPSTYLAAFTGSQTCDPENPNKTSGLFGSSCY
jgi:hypothetical protein